MDALTEGMLWIAVTLASTSAPAQAPAPAPRVDRVDVSARLLRSVEASKRGQRAHGTERIRSRTEKLPDGREFELIILDVE